MQTIQTQIQEYIGTDADTSAITDAATAGAKFIIDLLPQSILERWAKAIVIHATNGVLITGYRLFKDNRGYRARITSSLVGARTVDPYLAAKVADADSLHYATSTDPVVYVINQTLYIKPALTGQVDGIAYPEVLYSATSITDFPSEYIQAVVLYTAIHRGLSKINDAIVTLNAYTLATVTAPTLPSNPVYVYTDPSLGTYTQTTIGSLGTVPTFVAPSTDFSLTQTNTYIVTDEDIELGRAELERQRSNLEKWQSDIQNALATFNQQNVEYQSSVQKVIEQARLDQQRILMLAQDTTNVNLQKEAKELESQIAEYSSRLQNFSGELNLYSRNINKTVSDFQIKIQKDNSVINNLVGIIGMLKAEFNDIIKGIQNG